MSITTVQNGIVFKEPNFCQNVLRNRCISKVTTGCQLLGSIVGITAAVAGFYFGSLDGADAMYAYGVGLIGTFLGGYSACAFSYTADYVDVVQEAKTAKTLLSTNQQLAEQIVELGRREASIRVSHAELEHQVDALNIEVVRLRENAHDLEERAEGLAAAGAQFQEVVNELGDEKTAITVAVSRLTAASSAAEVAREAMVESVRESFSKVKEQERSVEEKEEALFAAIAIHDETAKLKEIKVSMETFKRENPHRYQELIEIYPGLRV
jgi:hypothetical protein